MVSTSVVEMGEASRGPRNHVKEPGNKQTPSLSSRSLPKSSASVRFWSCGPVTGVIQQG